MEINMSKTKTVLMFFIMVAGLACVSGIVLAAAPQRSGQPYAEATKCADSNVILCEDFNYPQNFTNNGDPGPENWINPGLANGNIGTAYGASSRRIAQATGFTTKPQGMMPSGSQPDYVWCATGGPGSTWGYLRTAGQNTYTNGIAKTKDIYIRFQLFWTSNWAWPGDPKTDKYNWGSSPCYDNKILYVYPPEGVDNPTSSAYDAALTAQYVVGSTTLTTEQQKAAEVSGDGKITAYDAALIAQRAVGLITKFPVEA